MGATEQNIAQLIAADPADLSPLKSQCNRLGQILHTLENPMQEFGDLTLMFGHSILFAKGGPRTVRRGGSHLSGEAVRRARYGASSQRRHAAA